MDDIDEGDRLVLVALQLIQQSIVRLPMAIAANLTTAHGAPKVATPAAASPSSGSWGSLTQGSVFNPIKLPPPPPPPPSTAAQVGSAASNVANFAANNQATRAASAGTQAVIGGLVSRFSGLLGPMQLLNQVISSQTSGFQVLGSATKVLAATIGPIILPVATVFAATLVTASDVLWSKLLPNLDRFNKFVLGQLIPAGEGLVGLFGKLSDAITWVINKTGGGSGGSDGESDGLLSSFGKLDKTIDSFLSGDIFGGAKGLASIAEDSGRRLTDPFGFFSSIPKVFGDSKPGEGGAAGGGVGGLISGVAGAASGRPPGAAGGAGGGGFAASMRDTLRELRLSLGTKASYTGIGEGLKNAQLAAVNQSPFETKILERMDAVIRSLERAAEPPPAAPVFREFAEAEARRR